MCDGRAGLLARGVLTAAGLAAVPAASVTAPTVVKPGAAHLSNLLHPKIAVFCTGPLPTRVRGAGTAVPRAAGPVSAGTNPHPDLDRITSGEVLTTEATL
ncbi:hypothetical protein BU52_31985 [Streptomyces toyocaensis]|uniref:Uncharacterized protein n=1 Tax=Streptomyces toyocaensis TaxID=55952 RepID=A0A081XHX5_STRTO|nr:hypothetical protein [Streptomyces toyocaensis]KES03148.1 hypothetical protein BU52_31985 [Streptomyces toyocaensis]